ncbi:hypothetical protein EYF80_066292 [Liparis tanakae]|nr:hypothetical protein EYF80_066292 [Liparis tanakae]
MPSEGGP